MQAMAVRSPWTSLLGRAASRPMVPQLLLLRRHDPLLRLRQPPRPRSRQLP
jgi:hypothetical protein